MLSEEEETKCKGISHQSRVVFLNGNTVYKGKFPNNKIVNTKYNIITFVPLVLFNQFKFFFNLFFLIIACTQFIEILRVGRCCLIQDFSSLSWLPWLLC